MEKKPAAKKIEALILTAAGWNINSWDLLYHPIFFWNWIISSPNFLAPPLKSIQIQAEAIAAVQSNENIKPIVSLFMIL